jgi:hypothetical protein
MPKKLARHLVKAKHNSMEGGVYISNLYFCASRMPSVMRSVYMHKEGKTFMLWESQQVLKNRENSMQFLGYMKNEKRV